MLQLQSCPRRFEVVDTGRWHNTKMSPAVIFFFVTATVLTQDGNAYLSEAAIKKTQLMVRNICIKKYPIEEYVIENVKIGEFPEDNENLKCYFGCIFKTMQLFNSNGVIEKKPFKDRLTLLLPPNILSIMLPAVEECGDKDRDSICQTSFNFMKCCYGVNPRSMEYL